MNNRYAMAAAIAVLAGSLATSANASPLTTDALGTHTGPALGAPSVAVAPAASSNVAIAAASSPCGRWGLFGGNFNTKLGTNWTSLAARSGPCTAASQNGSWGANVTFHVSGETNGQFICRGMYTYNYGTNIWFKTTKGYSWSGGTTKARWHSPDQAC